MTVHPLRTKNDYEAALKAIRRFIENEPADGTPEADEYDMLAMVIEKYEDEHFPIPDADPVAAVTVVMEANNYTRADLAVILGGQSRVSEFMKGRRDLSLPQIRRLNSDWRIPFDALITAEPSA